MAKLKTSQWVFIAVLIGGAALFGLIAVGFVFRILFSNILTQTQPQIASATQGAVVDYDWEYYDLDGTPISFSRHKGEVVFLNIWATWCPPCIKEMPSIDNLHRSLEQEGLIVIAVATGSESDDIQKLMESKGYGFQAAVCYEKFPAPKEFNAIPTSFLIDKYGNIVMQYTGVQEWDSEEYISKVRSLLAE